MIKGSRQPIKRKSAKKIAYDAEFTVARTQVIKRDRYCRMCGKVAGHVHHVQPRSTGGTNELSNLVLLCDECHTKVHTEPKWAKENGWLI